MTSIFSLLFPGTKRAVTLTPLLKGHRLSLRCALCVASDVDGQQVWRHTPWHTMLIDTGTQLTLLPGSTVAAWLHAHGATRRPTISFFDEARVRPGCTWERVRLANDDAMPVQSYQGCLAFMDADEQIVVCEQRMLFGVQVTPDAADQDKCRINEAATAAVLGTWMLHDLRARLTWHIPRQERGIASDLLTEQHRPLVTM